MARNYYIAHSEVGKPLGALRHVSARKPISCGVVSSSQEFEIQVLDAEGRASETLYFSASEIEAASMAENIPNAVLDAVRNLPAGTALYVNESGFGVSLF